MQRGDEIVEVVIQAPKVHDERTRELLRELAQVNTGRSAQGDVDARCDRNDRMAKARSKAAYMISAVAEQYADPSADAAAV